MKTHLLVIGILICFGQYSEQSSEDKVEELIKKRNLRSAGYTHFDVSHLHETGANDDFPANLVNSAILRRRKRDVTDGTSTDGATTFRLNAHGAEFSIPIRHAPSPLHPKAPVVVRNGNFSEVLPGSNNLDCFMTGLVASHDSLTAVFSFCDNMKGFFSTQEHTYWVESLEHVDRSHGASSRVLVARRPGRADLPPVSVSRDDIEETAKALMGAGMQDHHRQKRATYPYDLEIEMAVFSDPLATAILSEGGATTYNERMELLLIKWCGVKFEFETPGAFHAILYENSVEINITLTIKYMEFWDTNLPPGIVSSTNMLSYLDSFCAGVTSIANMPNFDHFFLMSGITGTSVSGKARIAGMCKSTEKCAMSVVVDPTLFWVEEHEIGHSLNMIHDQDNEASCHPPNDGIMGNEFHGWTNCSIQSIWAKLLVGEFACLSTTDVPDYDAYHVVPRWPGMVYTDDEVCSLFEGPYSGYRPKPAANLGPCPPYTCVDMDPESMYYGLMRGTHDRTIIGRRCGPDMYCDIDQDGGYRHRCLTWAETGLPDSIKTVVAGGWSTWSSETTCNRECGTGVRFRRRTCTNPKPQFSDWCTGSAYDATLCNISPCEGDFSDEAELITLRASETCAWLNANNLIGTAYENTGTKYSNSEYGMCEVKCDVKAGQSGDYSRFALTSDGTPCSDPDIAADVVELNKMPRRQGREARCLQGYCLVFGCDSKHSTDVKVNDGCGVCGGSGVTCTVTEGVFTTDLANRERQDIITIPPDATLIQVWFDYNSNKKHWIELWSASDVAIIAPKVAGDSAITDNLANPTSHAGTEWSYLSTGQFLFAPGPTDADTKIKVYYTGSGSNSGINYAYSIPTGIPEPTTTTSSSGTVAGETSTTQSPTTSAAASQGTTSIGSTSTPPTTTSSSSTHSVSTTTTTSSTATISTMPVSSTASTSITTSTTTRATESSPATTATSSASASGTTPNGANVSTASTTTSFTTLSTAVTTATSGASASGTTPKGPNVSTARTTTSFTTLSTAYTTATSTATPLFSPSSNITTTTSSADTSKGLVVIAIVVSATGGVLITAIVVAMFIKIHWKHWFRHTQHGRFYSSRTHDKYKTHHGKDRLKHDRQRSEFDLAQPDHVLKGYHFYRGVENPNLEESHESLSPVYYRDTAEVFPRGPPQDYLYEKN